MEENEAGNNVALSHSISYVERHSMAFLNADAVPEVRRAALLADVVEVVVFC